MKEGIKVIRLSDATLVYITYDSHNTQLFTLPADIKVYDCNTNMSLEDYKDSSGNWLNKDV